MEKVKLDKKILKFEKFLNEELRSKLSDLCTQRDELVAEKAEYEELETTVKALLENPRPSSPLKTKVDLGCNFYMQAVVPDSSKIAVALGFGFFAELTFEEALKFLPKKQKLIQAAIDVISTNICSCKAHIKLVYEGLCELQKN